MQPMWLPILFNNEGLINASVNGDRLDIVVKCIWCGTEWSLPKQDKECPPNPPRST